MGKDWGWLLDLVAVDRGWVEGICDGAWVWVRFVET